MRFPSRAALWDVCAPVLVAVVGIAMLPEHNWQMLTTTWQPSFFDVLPRTLTAAVAVCAFWLVAGAVLAAWLLRFDPALGRADAMLGGTMGIWVLAYLVGHLIGPIGLMRSWVLWLGVSALAAAVWRHAPRVASWGWSPGGTLAVTAVLLATPTLVLQQLGSPVPPHFDVFAPAAAAQRIVTFGHYLPYDNDPYGYYDAASQCPGTELLYAILALGSVTDPAILAETAAAVPLTALLVFATYRLGRSLAGDTAGGFAALALFGTVLFRMLPTGHGRYVAFVLVAAGLAFLFDERRRPVPLVLGAVFLGTAVAAHALIGAFGMVTAAGVVLVWLASRDLGAAASGIGLLAGAAMIALPTVAVAFRVVVPYPVLPLVQAVGLVVATVAARGMPQRPSRASRWLLVLVSLGMVALVWRQPHAFGMLYSHWEGWRYPVLWISGVLGIGLGFVTMRVTAQAVMLAAIGTGLGADWLAALHASVADPRVSIALHDFGFKADFWYPFALVFPAAALAAALCRIVPLRVVTAAVLVAVALPWQWGSTRPGGRDPNYYQHSVVEHWAEQLHIAKLGYWSGTADRRWTQSAAEFKLHAILRQEVAAGRITPSTHIAHVTPYIYLYRDTVLFSVFTGINDDLYVSEYVFDRSTAGGRFYPIRKIHEALARRPPYVVIHDVTVNAVRLADTFRDRLALDDYEELLNEGGVRLLRARPMVTPSSGA